MNDRRRAGFTLVELLIVVVLGVVVVLAAYETLITNQRAYSQQGETIRHNQTLRAGLEVISGELREISIGGGDLIGMGSDSIRIRVMRTFGIACSWTFASPAVFTVKKLGDWFEAGDSVLVFADTNTGTSQDDAWLSGRVTGVVTTGITCANGDSAQTVTASVSGLISAAQIAAGAPLRAFEHYWYGSYTTGGETYFARRAGSGGATEPLVGPLRAGNGVSFYYLDANGNTVATPANVRQIRVVLRVQSDLRDNQGRQLTDSIVSRIYSRN